MLLGAPRNGIATKVGNISSNGTMVNGIANPVSITIRLVTVRKGSVSNECRVEW